MNIRERDNTVREADTARLKEELTRILRKFAESGWDLIAEPSQDYLAGKGHIAELVAAIEQADRECGSCGCDYDPLYKRALELKAYLV